MTSLKGNLNSVDLANIFQMLSLNQREGTLYISDGRSKKAIYFGLDGVSMLSRGKPRQETLGRILLRFDRIDEVQLEQALSLQADGSRMLGEVLVEQGIVARADIEDALRIQIEEEIYNLFIWKDAQFEFVEGAPDEEFRALSDIATLRFSVNSLIMEAAQRVDEWEWIQNVVRSQGDIYRYTGRNVDLDDPIFERPYAGHVLAAIDGVRSVEEIIEASYVNRFEVCKILSLLLDGGALETVPAGELERLANTALAQGDTAAAVKFFTRLVELESDTPDMHRRLGEALEAEQELARAAFHHRVYAEVLVDQGDVAGAFEVYRRITQLLPTDLEALDRMIEVFATNPSGLEQYAAEIVEQGKSLAEIYSQFHRASRAVQVLHRVVQLGTGDPELRTRLIDVYLASGMTGEALHEYEVLAEQCVAEGNVEEAERILRRMLSIDKSRDDVKARLDQLQSKKLRRRRSIRTFVVGTVVIVCLAAVAYVGVEWWMQQQQQLMRLQEAAVVELEELGDADSKALDELKTLTGRLASAAADPTALATTYASELDVREQARAKVTTARDELQTIATEYPGTRASEEAGGRADALARALQQLDEREQRSVDTLQREAERRFAEASAMDVNGDIRAMLPKLEEALRIAAPCEEWLASEEGRHCSGLAEDVRETIQRFESTSERVRTLVQDGHEVQAYALALSFLSDLPPAQLAAEMRVPLELVSEPPGADVWSRGEPLGVTTPTTVFVSLPEGAEFELRKPGFAPLPLEITPVRDIHGRRLDQVVPRVRKATLQKEEHWVSAPLPGATESTPVLTGRVVLTATHGGRALLVDLQTGTTVGELEIDDPNRVVSKPVVVGDVSALPVGSSLLFHLVSERRLLRHVRLPGEVRADAVVAAGRVIVPTYNGRVVAVSADTFEEVWRYPSRGASAHRAPFQAAATVVDGSVVVPAADGVVFVLDAVTGRKLSEIRVGDHEQTATLVTPGTYHDGRYHVASEEGFLYALDLGAGRRVWHVEVGEDPQGAPVVAADGVWVVSRSGTLHGARRTDGRALTSLEVGERVTVGPAAAEDVVYVGDTEGRLTAIRVGGPRPTIAWRYELAQAGRTRVGITTTPVLTDEFVLFAGDDRLLRAIRR